MGEESKADDASSSLLKAAGVEMEEKKAGKKKRKKEKEKKRKRKRKRKVSVNDSGLRKSYFTTLIIPHYYYLV